MKRTGFLFDERFLSHATGPHHPEVPGRLTAIFHGIEAGGLLPHLVRIRAHKADLKWVETIHDKTYIARLLRACESGQSVFDSPDNQMCAQTFDTALLAVGGILETVDALMQGKIDNAFCAVRPPGHHAERECAMGFCYFNNVAIAARYLQLKWNVSKVGIVDFDVHHGNGTQHIFENDPSVFYYSIHQDPSCAYPGTGCEFEKGKGAGDGFTANAPMRPGDGDREYQALFQNEFSAALEAFNPEFMLLSTGFDAHRDDDMSAINLSTACFSWMMERLVALADRLTDGKIISILEGGYALKRLPELAHNHVQILLNA